MPLKRYPLREMGSTTLISIAGLWRRFSTVCGERMSAKTRWSSSHTAVVPLGERFGVRVGADGGRVAQALLLGHAPHVLVDSPHAFPLEDLDESTELPNISSRVSTLCQSIRHSG